MTTRDLPMVPAITVSNSPIGSKIVAGPNEGFLRDEILRKLTSLAQHGGDPEEILVWLRSTFETLCEEDTTSLGNVSTANKIPDQRRCPQPGIDAPRHKFVWNCPVSQHLYTQIERVAAVDSTVLLTGESGTGKSTIARMIHHRGSRSGGPFVAVNCGSLPRDLIDAELFGHTKGAFTGAFENRLGQAEAADGGTLFLDEIGDLPLELQPKLLTFLQERTFYRIGGNRPRRVDVRVISATHANLLEMSASAQFRRDLFFRLAVLRVQVPKLSERSAEIRTMATDILKRIAQEYGTRSLRLDEEACRDLEQYSWPGNIRELENILENAAAFCESDNIRSSDLCLPTCANRRVPIETVSPLLGKTLAMIESEAIMCALNHNNGNKARTARALGISLRSVYNKMRRHGLVVSRSPGKSPQ